MAIDRHPNGFWEQHIISAITSQRRPVALTEIYDWIGHNCDLEPNDLRETRFGGRPNYQHSIRSTASNMVRKEMLVWVERGVYRLP